MKDDCLWLYMKLCFMYLPSNVFFGLLPEKGKTERNHSSFKDQGCRGGWWQCTWQEILLPGSFISILWYHLGFAPLQLLCKNS